ncbi:MAG: 5'-methylthioadenosine/adenosylhomocysteine nucleosidase [Bacillota bacterium]|nr:5'-methylthioadenosine/adenosylhomocysteine nucleosidase [Bacillota bacterium]
MTDFKAEIGIIGAMQMEVDRLKEDISDKKEYKISGIPFVCGEMFGKKVVMAVSGVGKVFAAVCTEAMILNFSPEVIINTGVAGGLLKDFKIGNAAIAESLVQHDMDTSALGDPLGLISGLDIVNIPCDKEVFEGLKESAHKMGVTYKTGVIASGDQFVSDKNHKEEIIKAFNAIACEMEGAAIAQVCHINGVRCGVLRSISDGADDSADFDFQKFAKEAAVNSSEIIKGYIKKH